jgi:hypothetical protein
MAAARVNEGNAERRIFCRAKSNIGPNTGGWEYRLELADVPGAPGVTAVWVRWGEVLEGSARDLLAEAETTAGPEERDAVGEAEDWLGKLLNDGPVDSKEIPTAAKQSGIAWRTVERAKTRLGVKSRKRDYAAGWWWSLPKHIPPENDTVGGLGEPTPLKPSCGAGSTEDRQPLEEPPTSTPLKPSCGAGSTEERQGSEENQSLGGLGSNPGVARVPGDREVEDRQDRQCVGDIACPEGDPGPGRGRGMTPAAIIREAADGVSLALSPPGTIKAVGDQVALNRWLPVLREHKPAILAALAHPSLPGVSSEFAARLSAEDLGDIAAGDIPQGTVHAFEAAVVVREAEDLKEAFKERSAILQHDAGLPRAEAELEAARLTATLARNRRYAWTSLCEALRGYPVLQPLLIDEADEVKA